jgi:hypothetical protein
MFTIGKCSLTRHDLPLLNRFDESIISGAMVLNPDFKDFIESLNANGVRYLIVGDYAVALHGHPRYTQDMDVWIQLNEENAARMIRALAAFGFGSLELAAEDFLPGS